MWLEWPTPFSADKGATSPVFGYGEDLEDAQTNYFMVDFDRETPVQLS